MPNSITDLNFILFYAVMIDSATIMEETFEDISLSKSLAYFLPRAVSFGWNFQYYPKSGSLYIGYYA